MEPNDTPLRGAWLSPLSLFPRLLPNLPASPPRPPPQTHAFPSSPMALLTTRFAVFFLLKFNRRASDTFDKTHSPRKRERKETGLICNALRPEVARKAKEGCGVGNSLPSDVKRVHN